MFRSDYRIHVHRSRGDSGQGEAERTNSAIGDSVVDGATINWERHKQFEEMTEDKIKSLGVKEFEELEKERMEKNAWFVAGLLVERIDGAPVLSERIKAYLSEKKEDHFFFNRKYLLQFHSATTPKAKDSVPGSAYFSKIMRFYEDHYRSGELFMEFLKFDCHDTSMKLDFYRLYKTGFCTSSYVDILRNTQIRKDFIKFCISNHNLCIEVGRHCKPKVPREERLCKVCVQNEIEDEIHLLFHCTKYEYIRKQFLAKQSQILNLTSFDDYKKLCYILFTTSNKTSIHCTAKYISKCLLLRDK